MKVRGIAARRHDTPEIVRSMQGIRNIFRKTVQSLPAADTQDMVINRRVSRLTYAHRCIEGAAVMVYRKHGLEVASGMKIKYVVTDARRYTVEPAWYTDSFDLSFYRGLIDKAWAEIAFAFVRASESGRVDAAHHKTQY